MFIVIVVHQCKPGMIDAAEARIDENGARMAKIPGFLFRYRTIEKNAEDKISTVTGWSDEAAYENWMAEKGAVLTNSPSPYLSAVNTRHYVRKIDLPPA